MKKLELIKKYIKVNEIGKAQSLILKNIIASDIDISEKKEMLDLFISLIPDRQSGLITEMKSLLSKENQLIEYFLQNIHKLTNKLDVAIKEENIEYIEKIFLNVDLEKNTANNKIKQHLLDEKYYSQLKDQHIKSINQIYFSSSSREKISMSIDKIYNYLSEKLEKIDIEDSVFAYFEDEVMRDVELLIKHYAFNKIDYFIESIAKCYQKSYFPYKWEGKYPGGHIEYLT